MSWFGKEIQGLGEQNGLLLDQRMEWIRPAKIMYWHEGEVLGSAGCIDLATNMDDFVDNCYKKRVVKPYIRVKYDKESW